MPLLAFAAVVAILRFGRDLLMPFALAVLISAALAWPVTWLERRGLPRGGAIGAVMLLVLAGVGGGGWLVAHQMQNVVEELPHHRVAIAAKVGALTERLRTFRSLGDSLVDTSPSPSPSVVVAPAVTPLIGEPGSSPQNPLYTESGDDTSSLLRHLPAALGAIAAPFGTAAIVLLFVVFMLLNREDLRNRFLRVISNGDLASTTKALAEAWRRTGRYLGRLVVVNGAFGLAMGLGLFLLGVPGWALWGLTFTLLRFLPYVGTTIALALPLAMALATADGWGLFWATLALFAAVEIVVNLLIEPWFYGEGAGVSPFAVLVAAAVWTWLWGPMGLVLAMPLTVAVVVLGRTVPQLAFLDVLLGTDEVLAAPDRFYQRLMANDPDEAAAILDEVAASAPLQAVCEEVLVPALAAAERDRAAGKLSDAEYAVLCANVRTAFDELEDGVPAGTPAEPRTAFPPRGETVRGTVVVLPVRSGANEVAAHVLSRLLERAQLPSRTFSSDLTFAERVQQIDPGEIVCVLSLPDVTLRLARAACKRVHVRRPGLPLLVMPWQAAVDPAEWRYRALAEATDGVATNTSELTLFVGRIRQGLRAVQETSAGPGEGVELRPATS